MESLILQTPRLIIRKLTKADCLNLESILGDPDVMKFSVSGVMTESQIKQFLAKTTVSYKKNRYGLWGLINKSSNELIGISGLIKQFFENDYVIEISYRIRKSYQNCGYATEASSYIMKYAWEALSINELFAFIEPKNIPSIQVAEKLGFSFLKNYVFHGIKVKLYKKILSS